MQGFVPADQNGELVLYLGLGQSFLAQVPRLRPLGEKPGAVDAGRAWVFAENGDTRLTTDATQPLPEDALQALYPHLRHGRSGPLTAAAAAILAALRPQDRLLTASLARRNAPLDAFLPPGAAFRNVEACLQRTAELARERGLLFRRLVVSWVQGQADARTPHVRYLELLGLLVDALSTALAGATEGRGRLLFCLSQVTATYAAGRRGAPLAQLELAQARAGRVIIAGPDYMLERWDGVHPKPRSAVRLGAIHGRAIRQVLAGGAWEPLRLVDAVVEGCEVRVAFAGGSGDLEAAEKEPGPVDVGVRPLPHLGFVWQPAPGEATRIVAARISGPREVTLVLSEVPGNLAKSRLTLGFPEGIGQPEGFVGGDPTSARGGATGLRARGEGIGPFGEPVWDWALQQRIAPRRSETAR